MAFILTQDDILGYFVLAGHGVGFTNSQSDVNEFNTFMSQQKFTCVTTSGTAAAAAPTSQTKTATATSKGPTGEAVIGISPCPTAF
ncbi:hypothetical protein AYO50_02310 [Acidobacteria bacterium SCGC AG-212-P17]|nr:hypothetical protein AYO50_02310 [Acidobacteria bacterium SCGC AG-212-P17]